MRIILLVLLFSCQQTSLTPDLPKKLYKYQLDDYDRTIRSAQLIKKSRFRSKQIGYLLYDPQTKQILETHNADQAFIPASVNKIPTILAALMILGPDHRFKTKLYYKGHFNKKTGVLRGNLYLKGTGDPLLGTAEVMNMALGLKESGLKEITGQFIYDETHYCSAPQIDSIQDDYHAYNPGISALSSEFNRYYLDWQQDSNDIIYYFRPPYTFNFVELSDDSNFTYDPIEFSWKFPISSPPNGETRLPIKDPAHYTASIFAHFAQLNGIYLPPPESGNLPRNSSLLFTNYSPRLINLASSILEYSNNIMAELLLLATAYQLRPKAHSIKSAAEELNRWFNKKFPAVNWSNMIRQSGSGLDPSSRLTPQQLMELLKYASDKRFGNYLFPTLLPSSGWTGTLKGRLLNPTSALHIWAKTGTMNYVSSLAGYLYSNSGKKLIFVIFINDPAKRYQLDYGKSSSKKQRLKYNGNNWKNCAQQLQDQLLLNWIHRY